MVTLRVCTQEGLSAREDVRKTGSREVKGKRTFLKGVEAEKVHYQPSSCMWGKEVSISERRESGKKDGWKQGGEKDNENRKAAGTKTVSIRDRSLD